MKRRLFLRTLVGTLLLPAAGRILAATSAELYISARSGDLEHYFLSAFDSAGKLAYDLPLPGRGHGIALRPDVEEAVLVARRPGRFLVVFDAASGEVIHTLNSRPDRHFSGHGLFSSDGRWLFTSEIDYDGKRGVIGVRDVTDGYRQIDEFGSCGIEPHDLQLCRDGQVLVVANGGILTHPDLGRAKLNLDTMASSLIYLDAQTGRVLTEHSLPLAMRQLSLRHLAVPAPDLVYVAMQYQGAPEDRPALVAMHRAGENEIRLLQAPPAVLDQMRNYCGSVCADVPGRWIAVSSPQGNVVTFWLAQSGEYAGEARVTDGCGVAAGARAGEFLLSSGQGGLFRYDATDASITHLGRTGLPDARWDNHMMRDAHPLSG
ncbi:MAG: DUF1513 domain-containing protein [Gammaproteobacteria bacterium]|nr:DUF1513 domain-containing protein [Gammaproteobacteria bacterium]